MSANSLDQGVARIKRRLSCSSENVEIEEKATEQFEAIAGMKDCTASQMAVAWLLKQGKDVFVIQRCRNSNDLEKNLAALEVNLTDKDEVEIRRFVEKIGVQI